VGRHCWCGIKRGWKRWRRCRVAKCEQITAIREQEAGRGDLVELWAGMIGCHGRSAPLQAAKRHGSLVGMIILERESAGVPPNKNQLNKGSFFN
jgi:hypothetical protein